MEKKKNLWVIPTKNPSRLYYHLELKQFVLTNKIMLREFVINQNTYITNGEEIKGGDWFIFENKLFNALNFGDKEFICVRGKWGLSHKRTECKKIILTTNKLLIKDGVQAIDNEFLSWFVKNSSCRFVKTIKTEFDANFLKPSGKYSKYYVGKEESIIGLPSLVEKINYKIIIPSEENSIKAKNVVLGYKTSLTAQMLDKVELEELKQDYSGVHLRHCYQGEYENGCKYGEDDCPAKPLEESKQETLKEAAERYSYGGREGGHRIPFIEGVKWQQERSYSEEDMKAAWTHGAVRSPREFMHLNNFYAWFEQFSKLKNG